MRDDAICNGTNPGVTARLDGQQDVFRQIERFRTKPLGVGFVKPPAFGLPGLRSFNFPLDQCPDAVVDRIVGSLPGGSLVHFLPVCLLHQQFTDGQRPRRVPGCIGDMLCRMILRFPHNLVGGDGGGADSDGPGQRRLCGAVSGL